jgi:hypothetical protein
MRKLALAAAAATATFTLASASTANAFGNCDEWVAARMARSSPASRGPHWKPSGRSSKP